MSKTSQHPYIVALNQLVELANKLTTIDLTGMDAESSMTFTQNHSVRVLPSTLNNIRTFDLEQAIGGSASPENLQDAIKALCVTAIEHARAVERQRQKYAKEAAEKAAAEAAKLQAEQEAQEKADKDAQRLGFADWAEYVLFQKAAQKGMTPAQYRVWLEEQTKGEEMTRQADLQKLIARNNAKSGALPLTGTIGR